jgi:phosphoribosylamine-glycine ligase
MIRAVKRMKHKAFVVGNDRQQPGIQEADLNLITEDNNVEKVIEFSKKHVIDGIVPVPVDRPLIWQAEVADKLEVAKRFRHKYLMKRCLEESCVKTAKGIMFSKESFCFDLIRNFQFPLIVKPIDGYASRGVVRVDNHGSLIDHIEEASSFSSDNSFIIEEFIDGKEYNAEGVCYNNEVYVYAIVEKIRDPFPRTIEMGHIIPPDINDFEEQLIINAVSQAQKALGMNVGAFNAEVKIFNNEAYIIEVNGRLAGDFIVSHLIKPTTGQDMEEELIKAVLNIQPQKAEREYVRYGIIRFFNLEPKKKIKRIDSFPISEDYSTDLIWTKLFFKEGDEIPEVRHMGHRSGFVILLSDSRKQLMERCNEAINLIRKSIVLE